MPGIDELIANVSSYSNMNTKLIRKAYRFAEKAHAGQTRMSGASYISHPLSVAILLSGYHADQQSIIAALLHDVMEDTKYSKRDIEKIFGIHIAKMVDTLTKLPHTYSQHPSRFHQFDFKIESIRKIFDVMQRDVRVIFIKLCDRLHNMRTLHHFRPQKQQRIAQETLDVFVKIADRLCLNDLKEKLEKLCFRFLYPEQFEKYEQFVVNHIARLKRDKSHILDALEETKHISSDHEIYFKVPIPYQEIIASPSSHLEIYTEAVLIVDDVDACYQAVQDVHAIWKHIRGCFRDYISSPKSNGYRALETTLLTEYGSSIHFMIFTKDLYEYYRYGAMPEAFRMSIEGKKVHLPWIDYLKKIHQKTKTKSHDYMLALQNDILIGAISVYDENGKTIFLPPRSTVLDAAFYTHGKKAQYLDKVWINDVHRVFSNYLKENDKCAFKFCTNATITWEWVNMVNTSYGISQIYEIFQKLPIDKRIEYGHNILQQEVHKRGLGYIEEIDIKSLKTFDRDLSVHTLEDLYVKIAEGEVSVDKVCRELYSYKECDRNLLRNYDLEMEFLSKKPDALSGFFSIFNNTDYKIDSIKIFSSKHNGPIVRGTVTLCPQNFDAFDKLLHGIYDVRSISISEIRTKRITRSMLFLFIFLVSLDPVIAYYLINDYGIHSENLLSMRFVTIFVSTLFIIWYKSIRNSEVKEAKIQYFKFNFILSVISFFLTAYFSYRAFAAMFSPFAYQFTIYIILFPFFALYKEKYSRIPTILFIVFSVLLFGIYMHSLYFSESFEIVTILYSIFAAISFATYTHFSSYFQNKEHIHRRYLTFFRNLSLIGVILAIVPYFFVSTIYIPSITHILLGITYSLFFIVIPYMLYFLVSGIYSYTSSVWKQFIVILLIVKLSEWLILDIPFRPIELFIGFSFIVSYWIFSSFSKKNLHRV